MLAVLPVLENGDHVALCFVSPQDLGAFMRFANAYRDETRAVNGDNAYWLCSCKVVYTDKIHPERTDIKTILSFEIMANMFLALKTARAKTGKPFSTMFGVKDRFIAFSFGE